MLDYGGFEHNLQSLRTVDLLEERYAAFDGLNLCFETREGILKHCSPAKARTLGELGRRFLENLSPSLEAQICNLADAVAYNSHDIDDGLRSGLVTLEQLAEVDAFSRHVAEARREYPELAGRRLIHETIRRMINAQMLDLIVQTRRNIAAAAPQSLAEVHARGPLVAFSAGMHAQQRDLKTFLRDNLYRHYQVLRMTSKARRMIGDLFGAFMGECNSCRPNINRWPPPTCPRRGRLHRRHDGSLRHPRTPPPVRRRRNLNDPVKQ